jgi:hypothetical protein
LYETNRQRRCAPTSGNDGPKQVETFTEIRNDLPFGSDFFAE